MDRRVRRRLGNYRVGDHGVDWNNRIHHLHWVRRRLGNWVRRRLGDGVRRRLGDGGQPRWVGCGLHCGGVRRGIWKVEVVIVGVLNQGALLLLLLFVALDFPSGRCRRYRPDQGTQ